MLTRSQALHRPHRRRLELAGAPAPLSLLLLLELEGLLLELEGARAPLSLMLGAMSCQLSLLGALSLITLLCAMSLITLGVYSVAGTLRL